MTAGRGRSSPRRCQPAQHRSAEYPLAMPCRGRIHPHPEPGVGGCFAERNLRGTPSRHEHFVVVKSQVSGLQGCEGGPSVNRRLSLRWFEPNTCHHVKLQVRAIANFVSLTKQGAIRAPGCLRRAAQFLQVSVSAHPLPGTRRLRHGEYAEKFPALDAPPQVRRVRRPQRQRSAERSQGPASPGAASHQEGNLATDGEHLGGTRSACEATDRRLGAACCRLSGWQGGVQMCQFGALRGCSARLSARPHR